MDEKYLAEIIAANTKLRKECPMIGSITNTVSVNFVANAQLACGATAAMVYLPDEAASLCKLAKSAYLNLGTLLPVYEKTIPAMLASCKEAGTPWVLDPMGIGIGELRAKLLGQIKNAPPAVVKGNASEIIALAATWGLKVRKLKASETAVDAKGDGACENAETNEVSKGANSAAYSESELSAISDLAETSEFATKTAASSASEDADSAGCANSTALANATSSELAAPDLLSTKSSNSTPENTSIVESIDSVADAKGAAVAIAKFTKGAVVITGKIDAIVSEQAIIDIPGGSELQTKITGCGCALGGVIAAYCAVCEPFVAALAASVHFKVSANLASNRSGAPGTFYAEFIDALYYFDSENLFKGRFDSLI